MKQAIKNLVGTLDATYQRYALHHAEMKKIKKKTPLWAGVALTAEQEQSFQAKWGGYKVDDRWHRYYTYFTGKFDPNYVPEILFSTLFEPELNPRKIAKGMEDKAFITNFYGDVPELYLPQTVVKNCSGIYYDGDCNVLSKDEAMKWVTEWLKNHGSAIIKPTRDSCSGQNVRLLTDVKQCNEYTQNWIVQERVINQEDIRSLNPNSLNTFRVMTYIVEDEVKIAPIILRIGGGTSHLDNAHSGGMFIAVDEEGRLGSEAYTEYGEKYSAHPLTGVKFDGCRIQGIAGIRKTAVECHKRTPHLRMISWDLTIIEEGQPTLIEANLYGSGVWISQIAHGCSVWGEDTDKMLEFLK